MAGGGGDPGRVLPGLAARNPALDGLDGLDVAAAGPEGGGEALGDAGLADAGVGASDQPAHEILTGCGVRM